jgi:peptidyl-prolyl cis-trans isomerase B (cyclophilin B)
LGGANDKDAGALGEGMGGPAGAGHDLLVDRGGHGGLMGHPKFGEQVRQRPGGGLLGLIVDGHAHVRTTLSRDGRAGKRRFGVAGAGGRAWLKVMRTLRLCLLSALAVVAALASSSCNNQEQMKDPASAAPTPRAIIHTNYGDMTVEFWPDVAPRTVDNFLKLSRENFYNGTAFHRIIKGFMIQGGCPNSKIGARGVPGTGGPGYQVKAEFNNRAHVKGVLSMARSADPDSAGSQFFICHGDASFLNNKYTAFGKLVAGEEVLNKIAAVQCVGMEGSTPTERVEITSVELVGAK